MQIWQKDGSKAEHRQFDHERLFGWTALIRSAANGHIACVRLLLEKGANKDANQHVRRMMLQMHVFWNVPIAVCDYVHIFFVIFLG
jgi:hypothetical protein